VEFAPKLRQPAMQRMRVCVLEGGQDESTVQLDHLCAGTDPVLHRCRVSHRNDAVPSDGDEVSPSLSQVHRENRSGGQDGIGGRG